MSYNPSNYARCEKCKHIDRENEKCKITNDNWLVSDRAGTCHQFEGVESMDRNLWIRVKKEYAEHLGLDYRTEYRVLDETEHEFKVFDKKYLWIKKVWTDFSNKYEISNNLQLAKEFEENVKKGAEMLAKCSMSSANIEKSSSVNHPIHYNKGKFEVIDVIEDWNLGFNLGNTVKYIARCEYKENKKQDLEKAMWYLKREIERVKANV